MARVQKGKYYTSQSFLKANVSSKSSFTWKGIEAAKEVLIRGSSWRIGDGRNVLIADDMWVVGTSNGKVCVNPIVRKVLERVCELMQGPWHVWNANIIKECFSKAQGDLILAMPICDGDVVDQFIWSGNSKGVYSVKSEYYVAHDYLFNSASNEG
ncbi:hypothetical protein ACFE04_011396 [Oxalis oulophora]